MKNRLSAKINDSIQKKKKLFCAFLTSGYPNLKMTEKLIHACDETGVDILELGFPFSDPLADGPTIQFSSEEALKKGVTFKDVFSMVSRVRKKGVSIPIVFFSYFNPILSFGVEKFSREAKKAGIDAVLIPDLPPDEETLAQKQFQKQDISQVFLIAPTSSPARMKMISEKSQGFIYYVSLRGVTGARKTVASDVKKVISKIKKKTDKPVLVGFGVSKVEQAKELSKFSDGVIVGSALVELIRKSGGNEKKIRQYLTSMVRATQ